VYLNEWWMDNVWLTVYIGAMNLFIKCGYMKRATHLCQWSDFSSTAYNYWPAGNKVLGMKYMWIVKLHEFLSISFSDERSPPSLYCNNYATLHACFAILHFIHWNYFYNILCNIISFYVKFISTFLLHRMIICDTICLQ